MTPRLQSLLHLASVIDIKQEKREMALTEARRNQLSDQIQFLTKEFQAEYAALMELNNAPGRGEQVIAI